MRHGEHRLVKLVATVTAVLAESGSRHLYTVGSPPNSEATELLIYKFFLLLESRARILYHQNGRDLAKEETGIVQQFGVLPRLQTLGAPLALHEACWNPDVRAFRAFEAFEAVVASCHLRGVWELGRNVGAHRPSASKDCLPHGSRIAAPRSHT